MNTFKLGVVLESLGKPLRQALPEVARLGVPGVQVDAVGDLAPDRLGATGRREFRTLLKSYNLELAAVNVPMRHGLDAHANQQPRLEAVQKAMQLAFDLGCRRVVVPMPKLPTDEPAADAAPKPAFSFAFNAAPPKAVTLRESLVALGRHGDQTGVTVCVEGGLDPGDKLRDYLASFASGSLGVTFDPANFLVNGFDPLASLSAVAKLLRHAHARDARTSSAAGGPQEVPVGAGDIDWLALVATLEAVEFRGVLCVESSTGDDTAAAGVRFLRRFVPEANS